MAAVTLVPLERTGNNMFQLAAAYSLCKNYKATLNVDCSNESMKELLDYLGNPFPCNKPEGTAYIYTGLEWKYPPNPTGAYDCLIGWFQDPRYFHKYSKEIRQLFKKLVKKRVPGKIGVHLRLGDYLSERYAKDYFTLSKEDIVKGLGLLGHKDQQVVVYTDDKEEAAKRMPDIDYVFDDHDSAIEVLKDMSSCEYLLASNSTLSWWACWLGKIPYVSVHYPWTKFNNQDCLYEVNWATFTD